MRLPHNASVGVRRRGGGRVRQVPRLAQRGRGGPHLPVQAAGGGRGTRGEEFHREFFSVRWGLSFVWFQIGGWPSVG